MTRKEAQTHLGPGLGGGLDDAEEVGGGNRAGGGGGHLGVLGGRGGLLRRHSHDGAGPLGPGCQRAEAKDRRRRVAGILGEGRGGGGGGGGGREKIPCHWC